MSKRQAVDNLLAESTEALMQEPQPELQALLSGRSALVRSGHFPSVATGELVAIADEGRSPLVRFPGQPGSAAVRARSVVDLHGPHIGQPVVLMFEEGDPARPIVMGVLRQAQGWPMEDRPAQVEVVQLFLKARHGSKQFLRT